MYEFAATDVPRDWVEWLVIVFTVGGVCIAILQSFRSASVAKAAKEAIEGTERHLASNQLIGVLSQLQHLEIELTECADTDDRKRVIPNLLRWRQQAAETLGVLEQRTDVGAELLNSFRRLTAEANQAHLQLADSNASVLSQTKALRTAAASALSEMSRYAGALKSTSSGGLDRAGT